MLLSYCNSSYVAHNVELLHVYIYMYVLREWVCVRANESAQLMYIVFCVTKEERTSNTDKDNQNYVCVTVQYYANYGE